MSLRNLALINALRQTFMSITPGVTMPDETIDGFPEYAFTVDTLKDPAVKQKLRELAKRIVASHKTPKRIIGFEVHGHSDNAMRIPRGPERERTEREVSTDRAEHAKELLLEMIEQEGGKPIIQGIKANATAKGFGAKFTKFNPAKNETEMRRNRRVEIFLKTFEQPPPKPTPPAPPKPPPQKVTGTQWKIKIKSGTIISVPNPLIDITPVDITMTVVIMDVDRKLVATFSFSGKAQALPGGAGGPPTFITSVPPGPEKSFTTRDGVSLHTFRGTTIVDQNPAIGVIATAGGEFMFDFECLHPVFTVPRVVEVAGGFSPALPTLGGGFAGISGTLTMSGEPRPAP